MARPEFRGARASNAGDDFHELWALLQALTLLDRETDLSAITVEGLRPEDEKGSPSEAFDGVDCAMFYKGSSVVSAERIEIIQFKYSAANSNALWTTARLTSSSARKRDNSVIRRLAETFKELRKKRNGSPEGISVQLISNQPADPKVIQLLQDLPSGRKLSDEAKATRDKLQKSTGLKGDAFREFVASLDLSQTGSRFLIKESILRTISTWTEGDSRALTDSLLRFVRQKMMPESKGEWIIRESILTELGFSDARALFPCPPELARVRHLIRRKTSSEIVDEMTSGRKYICVHGHAGCGKTTTLLEIESQLPAGSLMLVFDCYGAGRYLDSDAYRHRPKDAFRQLSNDLAPRLHVPLLLTRNDGVDYPHAFHDRLEKAAQAVSDVGQGALLIIAVDAADNSVTAAEKLVPQEHSFVSDFVYLGDIPDNVRLLVTARTGRLKRLALPNRFKCFEVTGFTREETAEHVRSIWDDATDPWIDDFHELSGQNPRVQEYALRWAGEAPGRARDFLLPSGKGLTDVFRHQFDEAQKKAGTKETLDRFSAALAALPHPVAFSDLSAISGLTEPELADICADLAPGIRTTNRTVGFGDEDFESFIRDEGRERLGATQLLVADRFMMNRGSDPYAATHLVAALYAVGRRKDIIQIVENEAEPAVIVDPILRREIRLQRLRIAMQVCTDMEDGGSMLRTLLIGAEAMRGSEAILNLVLKFPDLAAAFMQGGAVRLVLQDSNLLEHHGRLLFHLFRERASALNRVAARGEYQQLGAWLERRRRELDNLSRDRRLRGERDWEISAIDLAAEVETVQKAFNSPFRPFVLATTSIGQEGLDFHPYCHVVYHWNLPSNPVELEQREGRVHRYKGHAIRKNIALTMGIDRLRGTYQQGNDAWRHLFEFAVRERDPGKGDLIPYWIYPLENGASVERRVPMLPFSREQQRLPDLKASLAVYRLVFGQPRQEDLLSHLKDRDPAALSAWRFDLSPPAASIIDDLPEPPSEGLASGANLVCHRCGDEVGHPCVPDGGGKSEHLHWRTGDRVRLFYRAAKNGGPEYSAGEVLLVNDERAEVQFEESARDLQFRGGNVLWDQERKEHCRLVSHVDPSGGEEIALICPTCGQHRQHRCHVNGSARLPFGAGARIEVTYGKHPGLDDGTFPAFVVRVAGRVARVYFDYENGETGVAHLYLSEDGSWRDLDYGVPCGVVSAEQRADGG